MSPTLCVDALSESDPQRRHKPVGGLLVQAGAKDSAQVDVLAVGLAHLEELSLVYPALQDELHPSEGNLA